MANGEKAGKIIGFYVKVIVKGQYSPSLLLEWSVSVRFLLDKNY